MNTRIQSMIPNTDLETAAKNLQSIIAVLAPHYAALSNEEKVGLRTMSTAREGYVRAIDRIALANVDALPRNIDPGVLSAKLEYAARLAPVKQELLKLTEMIDEIEMANGADIMKLSDTLNTALQAARNHNSALDGALKDIDEWNKRFGRRDEDAATGAPAAETL
jgi:predicted ATP-binding protein involved in virulence